MTRMNELLQGYRNNRLSPDELRELLLLLDSHENTLQQAILNDLQQNAFTGLTTASQRDELFNRMLEKRRTQERARVVPLRRWVAAASVLLIITAAVYIGFHRSASNELAQQDKKATPAADIQPGGNKALLTLADGSTIMLDSAGNGVVARQGGVAVRKLEDGRLQYESTVVNRESANEQPVSYNKLSTPRGGQYQLVLPDGSKVWLNAASTITYPTQFAKNERKVTINGEAYFEVAKDASKPFHVTTLAADGHERADVTVLGTHFNVNAYDDEKVVAATLLEGKVKVQSAIGSRQSAILNPGEQAVVKDGQNNSPITVAGADVDQVVSWKNGQFFYSNTDITTIMRQLSRWYDVEVEYKAYPKDSYTVSLSRNVPVSKLLNFLEMSGGVHFVVEGKKIIVQ